MARNWRYRRNHQLGDLTCAISASMRFGSRRFFRRPWPTSAMTSPTIPGRRPIFGTLERFRYAGRCGACEQSLKGYSRSGPEPHVRSTSVVYRKLEVPAIIRNGTGTFGASRASDGESSEQLDVGIWWQRLELRPRLQSNIIIMPSSSRAARSELAQSGGASGDLRCHAFLAPRKGVDGFRVDVTLAFDQGCRISRQPAQSAFSRWGRPPHEALLPLLFNGSTGDIGRGHGDAARG